MNFGTTQMETQIREEKLKTTKALLIEIYKKLDRLYDKLMSVYTYVNQESYWEKLDNVRKEIKYALNVVDEILYDLKDVNTPAPLLPEEESETEIRDEKQLKQLFNDKIYDIFNDLASIYEKVIFIVMYTLEARFYEIYGKIEYKARRALWNAMLMLVELIYDFTQPDSTKIS